MTQPHPLLRKLRRAAGLQPADWALFLRAAAWLVVVAMGLKVTSYRRVRALVDSGLPLATRPPEPARLARLAEAVDRVARNAPRRPLCLARSLALYRLVRRDGFPATLRIGVRRPGRAFEAHAWVESGGAVMGDRSDVAEWYTPLAAVGAATGGTGGVDRSGA